MTVATVIIKDAKNEAGENTIEMEGHIDPVNALELPPTPALIIGSYLAANSERVCRDAMAWFGTMVTAAEPEPEPIIKAPSLILTDIATKRVPS